MNQPLYKNLPTPPSQINSGAVLARFIDSVGFRFQMATDGFTENEINFRPVEGSMNMMEMMDHIYKVLWWAHQAFDKNVELRKDLESFEDYRNATLQACHDFKTILLQMSEEEINQVTVYRKRNDTTYSFWYLINGPIADVLTHIGQIVSWRRIAGNPVALVSPFTGESY